ncbi:MAG: hypothetical protein HY719_17885 [Planctomycetes bacterium]|nr:hypothetical protein [Planctomycetota bacterium]
MKPLPRAIAPVAVAVMLLAPATLFAGEPESRKDDRRRDFFTLPDDVNPYKPEPREIVKVNAAPGARLGHSRYVTHGKEPTDPQFESIYNFDAGGPALDLSVDVFLVKWLGLTLSGSFASGHGNGDETSNSGTKAQAFVVPVGYSPLTPGVPGAATTAFATDARVKTTLTDTRLHGDFWLRLYPWMDSGPTTLDFTAGYAYYQESWVAERLSVRQVAVETPAGSGVFLPGLVVANLPNLRARWENTWTFPRFGVRTRHALIPDVAILEFNAALATPLSFSADGKRNLQGLEFEQDSSNGIGFMYGARLQYQFTPQLLLGVGFTGATLRARAGSETTTQNNAPLREATSARKISSTRNTITLDVGITF